MIPIDFPEKTADIAKDQPEYLTLPAWIEPNFPGRVVSCWSLSWKERIRVLFTGRLWLSQLTFGENLQPQLPSVEKPAELPK